MEEHKCKYCGRIGKTNCGNVHHENSCMFNPNRRAHRAWNKGISDPKHAALSKEMPNSIFGMSSRTLSKVMRRMKVGCSLCGWFVEGVVCDFHHIVAHKDGGKDVHENVTYICPNCHRMTHSGKIDSSKLINLVEFIGDKWKEFIYYKK